MPGSAGSDLHPAGGHVRPTGPGAVPAGHSLAVLTSPRRDRLRVTSWVQDAVRRGERVVYQVLLGSNGTAGEPSDWLTAGLDRTGQVQFLDVATLRAETGGDHRLLRQAHVDLIERARRDGFAGLAVTGDAAALRVATRDAEQLRVHERDLDELAADLPFRALCRFDEREPLMADVLAVHFRAVEDAQWAASLVDGCLWLSGEIDMSNTARLSAVLDAALAAGVRDVELSELRFCSAAGVGILAAAAAGRHGTVALRNPSPAVERILRMLGPVHREESP